MRKWAKKNIEEEAKFEDKGDNDGNNEEEDKDEVEDKEGKGEKENEPTINETQFILMHVPIKAE